MIYISRGSPASDMTAPTGKPRLSELARELGVSVFDLFAYLKEIGEVCRSASSVVEAPVARRLRAHFIGLRSGESEVGALPPTFADDHVLISYSRTDITYVQRLNAHLLRSEVPIWYDRHLVAGARFADEIQRHIDTCVALLVVMTPAAIASRWVKREISCADELDKTIVPLLLLPCSVPLLLRG